MSIAVSIGIGILFGMFFQSIVFLVMFIPLRMYAGGYHAKTQIRCSIVSVCILCTIFEAVKIVPWYSWMAFIIFVISFLTIFFLAPVENDKKRLDKLELQVYKIKTRKILILESIVAIICIFLKLRIIYKIQLYSLAVVAIILLLGKLKYSSLDKQ